MVRHRDKNLVYDVKVIRSEPCIPQHKLMVCQFSPKVSREAKENYICKQMQDMKIEDGENTERV